MDDERVLDVKKLYVALNAKRGKDSWYSVANTVGVGASTFTRITQGHPPNLEAFLRLLLWLEEYDIRKFVKE